VTQGRFVDYYKVLQVDEEADREVIEAAFRRLARKYHPDTNRSDDAEETMKLLTRAYTVLSDPQERVSYDACRRAVLGGGEAPVGPFVPPRPAFAARTLLVRLGVAALVLLVVRLNPRVGLILAVVILLLWLVRGLFFRPRS